MPLSSFFIASSNYDRYRAEDNQIQFICENAFDHLNVLIRTHVNLERNVCINESFTLHPYGWDHKRYNRMITAIQSNCTNFLWEFLFMCFMCSSKIIFIALHYCIFWIKLSICLRFLGVSWNLFEDRLLYFSLEQDWWVCSWSMLGNLQVSFASHRVHQLEWWSPFLLMRVVNNFIQF